MIALLLVVVAGNAGAQANPVDSAGNDREFTAGEGFLDPSAVQMMIHFGGFTRSGGVNARPGRANFMFTGNLDFLKRPTGKSTWGVGVRISGDDDGSRVGARFLYRHGLGNSAKGYWQLSPGLNFAGSDNKRTIVIPAGFCELEVGNEAWGAISVAVEAVPYKDMLIGYRYNPDIWTEESLYDQTGTELSWYVGAKGAGWKGAIILLALMVGVSIAMNQSMDW